jgi:hypothetical protein
MAGKDRQNGADRAMAEALSRVLDRQRDLYRELDALSERQRSLIEGGQTDELLSLLAERGEVVGALEKAAAEMGPLQAALDAVLADGPDLDESTRSGLRAQVVVVRDLAAQVATRDAEDQKRLLEQREALSGRMRQTTNGRGAINAYGKGLDTARGPRFQDRSV